MDLIGNTERNMDPVDGGRFFTGLNYWGCDKATRMWAHYDEHSVEADLRAIASCGVTHLRVFPLWPDFQPLTVLRVPNDSEYEYRFGEDPLPDTPAGRAGVSEEACGHFGHFCACAEKYGLKLIVGLITGHMSFRDYCPPAFNGKDLMRDASVIRWQVRFVRYFVTRFRSQECIAGWDLGNEVSCMAAAPDFRPEQFYVWASLMANTIRACDPVRPVISGLGDERIVKGRVDLSDLGEYCDVQTVHPYHIFETAEEPITSQKPVMELPFRCAVNKGITGLPVFVQEFGSIGYANCSRRTEADFYRASALACLAHGCHGLMWWCAFDQGHLRFAPYDWNNIGSDYGFFDRNRAPKPVAEENLRFTERLKCLPGGVLPPADTHGVIVVPRDEGHEEFTPVLRAAWLTGCRAGLNLGFTYALDPIPDAPLYIMPSVDGNKAILARRLDEILKKTEQGAVFFLSLGRALFRQIPEIFGVEIALREARSCTRTLCIGGERLPVRAPVHFTAVSCGADAVLRDTDGEPVLFAKRHGKGTVFLMTAPLERAAAETPGAFTGHGMPAFEAVYRLIAEAAGVKHYARSSSPLVLLTEHTGIDGTSYVFALNCNPTAEETHIACDGRLVPLFGPEPDENGTVTIPPCDGALWRVEKQ